MLAIHARQQHFHDSYSSRIPSPPPSQSSFLDTTSHTSTASTQADFDVVQTYLESLQPFAASTTVDRPLPESDQYMTSAYNFSNPAIRIQQSTPIPQFSSGYSQTSMLPTSNNSGLQNWNSYENNGRMDTTQSLQTSIHRTNRTHHTHQRAASSSSIGSNGSQYQTAGHTTGYPYVANSENSPSASSTSKIESSYGADEASRAFSNHLPTPTHTPTQDSFMNPNFHNYNPNTSNMDSTMSAHLSMKQALLDQHPEDELPAFGHSARHSVSSYDSPATPHTGNGEDFEDKFKVPPTGETIPTRVESWFDDYLLFDDDSDIRHTVPKFDNRMTDMALDLYNQTMAAQIPHSAPQANANPALLSPYRNVVSERLQAAHNARSQSPASSASRGVSPFRQGSPYAAPTTTIYNSPHMRVGTTALAREAQKVGSDAFVLRSRLPPAEDTQPKTISPKDALLDYHEADEKSKAAPSFPEGPSEYENQYNGGDQYSNAAGQSHFDTSSEHNYRRDSWAMTRFSPNFSTTSGPSPPQTNFTFVPPAISGNMHGLPFSQQYRSTSNMASASEQTPEFPAHLTSMDSSASEAGPETGSTSSDHLQKPASSTADTGTYTCTYHNCTLRFETPQKLQKHKREAHRQNANVTSNAAAVGSGMTSAALLERNSQAGPHKCERINPTTGKPCNTIFSRPYDLTRHEDTIHNSRKQKVRCALCVEEKTFSRNDALTRHMRVVHPEVDFPGKHRKRGGNHD
ncbi:hypothetical protein K432DRAFT_446328 [Lepidopterella palustris CBS 459.81]|uniref:C2H2-type domain-containing protein n=1 Tax=Lepidopterella palustris CBS 459.81 TaxID=1314670 RepID=A0A8E2JB82_9PEZI|nr:hypothetical protein K432DRAFT_446328 [Lepidopterella palustris CBS 459.81]